jgi:hypothetical protein
MLYYLLYNIILYSSSLSVLDNDVFTCQGHSVLEKLMHVGGTLVKWCWEEKTNQLQKNLESKRESWLEQSLNSAHTKVYGFKIYTDLESTWL